MHLAVIWMDERRRLAAIAHSHAKAPGSVCGKSAGIHSCNLSNTQDGQGNPFCCTLHIRRGKACRMMYTSEVVYVEMHGGR